MEPGEPTFEEFKASTLANFPEIDPWEAACNLQLSLMRRYEEIAGWERRFAALAATEVVESVLINYEHRGAAGVADYLEQDWGSEGDAVVEFAAALAGLADAEARHE